MVRAALAIGPLPPSVTTVGLGGEPPHASTIEELYRGPNVARVLNMYGPAEDTTYTTFEQAMPDGRSLGIGHPVTNERVHILDAWLRPVPPGVAGEIHVAGTGLARGYCGAGGLTAGRFVPDPFGASGARMYATGDIGRHLADGRIQCLGRTDAQVKVNGIRVEPAEVESVLLEVPSVAAAAVVAAAGGKGARRLVACVAWNRDVREPRPGLRAHLARHLPGTFVPSAIVELEHLPRTSSGKVDRSALRALVERRTDSDVAAAPAVQPRTATEELLAGIWSEVLDRRPIGVHDDFFDLGGHSLLATQVAARLRSARGVEVPVRTLFEASTIATLAEYVDRASASGTGAPAPGIRPIDRDRYRMRGEDAGGGAGG
jgi:hypothetical protein